MSSLVLIDCSGIPLSTREGFVCAKETIQEGRKLFFACLTLRCVAVLSSQQLAKIRRDILNEYPLVPL